MTMKKNLAICLSMLLTSAGGAGAATVDYAGNYSGKETLVVSACVDKTATSPWQASFSLNGDAYTGEGSSTNGGKFTFTGKVADGIAQGTVEGRTPEGRLWEGKTRATLSPDGELAMRIDGRVPTAGCNIVVTINAGKTSY